MSTRRRTSVATSDPDQGELMSAYLDAELEEGDVEAFESYLAESPEAREELDELRKVVSLVSALPEVRAPEDFYEKVSKSIRRRQLFAPDNPWLTLASLPFQVLSIIVILTVAGLYMMAQLEQKPKAVEREPAAPSLEAMPSSGEPQP